MRIIRVASEITRVSNSSESELKRYHVRYASRHARLAETYHRVPLRVAVASHGSMHVVDLL